ncbi:hypothetical protein N601_01520 [Rhodococcus erythropolis DN1]|nr:hypothetical protein N601_01520 [Rhodococcus erythropolis DN1]
MTYIAVLSGGRVRPQEAIGVALEADGVLTLLASERGVILSSAGAQLVGE